MSLQFISTLEYFDKSRTISIFPFFDAAYSDASLILIKIWL